ncbi:MAG: phosphonate ABC transporter, permease protein PhnE, partial [Anaerolineae bacterium]
GRLGAGSIVVAADGTFEAEVEVRPILGSQAQDFGQPVTLQAEVRRNLPHPTPSRGVRETASALVETVLMAFMATTFGAALAFPLGILGARNMMPRTPLGASVYAATRTFLNVVRSVEPVILGAFFASWVRYGSPFAGVLALAVVTVANLGKLFSEAVENIDPGPVEAVGATGAGWLQTVVYAVVPQIVPPYLSFGMYQWDINVRVSTIIGFVGGGGIGFLLLEWIKRLQWTWASVAVLGVVIVVSAMDAASAAVRQRIT